MKTSLFFMVFILRNDEGMIFGDREKIKTSLFCLVGLGAHFKIFHVLEHKVTR